MGRISKYQPGTIHHGFEILPEQVTYKAANRLIYAKCTNCGTQISAWNTAFHVGRVRCPTCKSAGGRPQGVQDLSKALLAVYDGHAQLLWPDDIIPSDANLYKFESPTLAVRYIATGDSVPKPDQGYAAYLAVPEDWVKFYCEESGGDLSEAATKSALEHYSSKVVEPGRAYSRHTAGSRSTWVADGTRWAYIYWLDTNTWPIGQPPHDAEAKIAAAVPAPAAPPSKPCAINPADFPGFRPKLTPEEEAESQSWILVRRCEGDLQRLEKTLSEAQEAVREAEARFDPNVFDLEPAVLTAQVEVDACKLRLEQLKEEVPGRLANLLRALKD